MLLEHDLRWRETLHTFNVRSSFEEDIMIVIMLYQEEASVIRFEELGRMALISPYVIDTRIQRLRFVGDIAREAHPALLPEKLEQRRGGWRVRRGEEGVVRIALG